MNITFKQFLVESSTELHKLANKIGIQVSELKKLSDAELTTILRDIGKHDFTPISKFNKKELEKGIKAEKEHTNSVLIATLIAKDHLSELPDYYTRLEKLEK